MSQPAYDPRLFQKNFAMPMLPGQIMPPVLPPVRRKDGVPSITAESPAYGPNRREPQETVTIRPRGGSGTSYTHPWKIEVDADLVLRVNYGAVSATVISDGDMPHNVDCPTLWDSTPTYLKNDPFYPEGTVGSSQLATSNTYGVWMAVNTYFSLTNIANPFGNASEIEYSRPWLADVNTCSIVVTNSQSSPTLRFTGNSGDIGYFLGQVEVDGDDVVTIRQHRRSDIILPFVLWPWGIVFP